MLKTLPDLKFPITQNQFDPLMSNLVQVNILDGALNENVQRGLGLFLHTHDLWCKSGGKIDYRGPAGHQRLMQDAMVFCGSGNPVATRHGDLAAAHLSIDFSDTQIRLKAAGCTLLSSDVNDLIAQCRDLSQYSLEMERRVGLLMDCLGKKPLV